MILVDTSAWVEAMKRQGREIKAEIDSLIAADEVATTEIIIAELLQGSRTEEEYRDWQETLDALHYFPTDRDIWERAARISYELRRRGQTTGLSDLVIAVIALDNDLPIYAIDTDFVRVPGIKLHQPGNSNPVQGGR